MVWSAKIEDKRSEDCGHCKCLEIVLDEQRKRQFLERNLLRVNAGDEVDMVSCSPFVLAIAGHLLLHLPDSEVRNKMLRQTGEFLESVLTKDGLVGFLHPNAHRYELDTVSFVHSFLMKLYGKRAIDRFRSMHRVYKENKDKRSGAYLTWLDKQENRIDWVVNLNIRATFCLAEMNDPSLNSYLLFNADRFLQQGSYYYRDISFPCILMLNHFIDASRKGDEQLSLVIRRCFRHREAIQTIDKFCDWAEERRSDCCKGRNPFRQYFNSRYESFQSHLLDDLLFLAYKDLTIQSRLSPTYSKQFTCHDTC